MIFPHTRPRRQIAEHPTSLKVFASHVHPGAFLVAKVTLIRYLFFSNLLGEDAFDRVVRSAEVERQRASALRFGDKRVQALFAVLVLFSLQLRGFSNGEMRTLLAQLLGLDPADYPIGRMTYYRLRLHGIIERIPHSHRYQLTSDGLRIALFSSRTYARLMRPKLAQIMPEAPPTASPLRAAFDRLTSEIDACCKEERPAA